MPPVHTSAWLDHASRRLKVLAGRTRLQLLMILSKGEAQVGILASLTGMRDTAVSQQLAILRDAGLVTSRRQGQGIFYSLAEPGVSKVLEAILDHV